MAKELQEATGLPPGGKVPPDFGETGAMYRAKRHFIANVTAIRNTIVPAVLEKALLGYLGDATRRLYHGSMVQVRPLTVQQSINGALDVPGLGKYMGPIDKTTSAGWPYGCPKSRLASGPPGQIVFNEEIMTQVDSIEQSIRAGVHPLVKDVMFDAHLKDEPVKPEKRAAAKYRVIIGSPLAFLVVFRRYYLPILAFIGANRLAFEACPNTVAQSYEWTLHRKYVVGPDRVYFDGDYKGWDASLQKSLVLAFFRVCYVLARRSGNYSEVDLLAMAALALVVSEAHINFFGDLIRLDCFNPSGQPATAQTNSIINSILFRIAWIESGHDISMFRGAVRLLTYGDDNWGSIQVNFAHSFNKRVIKDMLEPHGVFYTNADKTPDITPDTPLEDIDFLKRSWVWNDEALAHFCPLAVGTLSGMVTTLRLSSEIGPYDQMLSSATSLAHESFFHGRDFFQQVTTGLVEVFSRYEMGFKPPNYDDKLVEFHLASEYFRANEARILACLTM